MRHSVRKSEMDWTKSSKKWRTKVQLTAGNEPTVPTDLWAALSHSGTALTRCQFSGTRGTCRTLSGPLEPAVPGTFVLPSPAPPDGRVLPSPISSTLPSHYLGNRGPRGSIQPCNPQGSLTYRSCVDKVESGLPHSFLPGSEQSVEHCNHPVSSTPYTRCRKGIGQSWMANCTTCPWLLDAPPSASLLSP